MKLGELEADNLYPIRHKNGIERKMDKKHSKNKPPLQMSLPTSPRGNKREQH